MTPQEKRTNEQTNKQTNKTKQNKTIYGCVIGKSKLQALPQTVIYKYIVAGNGSSNADAAALSLIYDLF
ncbi:hypothetical protein [Thiolapillus sp.]|uniref:hypothetical protein n=1 Tax=Thiolapillus sp. TaxID=2017437 RepID=UPI003AF53DF8